MKSNKLFFRSPFLFCCFLTLFQFLSAQNVPRRIGNSPYPLSVTPDTLFAVNIGNLSNDQQLTVVTLQGLLARTKPRIMVSWGATIFQADLSNNYHVTYDSTYFNDFTGLIRHFSQNVTGYLLCNLNDTTTNVAISLCSFYNAIAVTPNDSLSVDSVGLSLLYDVTGKAQSWALDTFKSRFNNRIITLQDPVKCTYLSDYSIFAGAFHFWDGPSTAFSDSAFDILKPNAAMMGWGSSEDSTVTQSSQHGTLVHASDWASNLSTYTNFNATPVQKNHSDDTIIVPNTRTVCFVMTDGDNVQWITNNFATSTDWYGSPHRGLCNIGWTLSPALAELAPTLMKYIYDSAASTPAGQDYFIAGPSGMGYFYPDQFTPLDSAVDITSRMMQKADMSIVNVIGNSDSDIYLSPYLDEPNIDALFYYTYADNYQGASGFATCINGKPVISARFGLWGSFFTPKTVAQLINLGPANPYSSEGYSLIAVNVWTNTVDSILSCISALDSNTRVVTPDAFVKLFKAGVCNSTQGIHNLNANSLIKLNCTPNPVNTHAIITYTITEAMEADLSVYDVFGRKAMNINSGFQTAGFHQVDLNASGFAAGVYCISMRGQSIMASVKCVVVR